MGDFKNILFIFPVMGYYLLESVIAALFVRFVWRFFLQDLTGVYISYLQWVAIIWIIKVIFFDVFKLISGLSTMNNPNDENNEQS
jgi:hypothetical protein